MSARSAKTRSGAANGERRRATVLVKVAILVPVIGGFAAFGVEMTMLHALQNDAQRAADAAALAVAGWMARQPSLSNIDSNQAFTIAQDTVNRNNVGNSAVTLASGDVVLGQASYNAAGQAYTWSGAGTNPSNAVQVTVRRTSDSPSGAVPLLFARIIGRSAADVSAVAQAAIAARTWAVVVDNSEVMNNDSELINEAALGDMDAAAPNGTMNARQMWDDLVANASFPASGFGNMNTWHTNAAAMPTLTGNSSTIMTALGLNGVAYPLGVGGTWSGYISYQGSNARGAYKSKFGLRTFVQYLNEMQSSQEASPALAATRQQPLYTLKQTVLWLADMAEIRGDQMSVSNGNMSHHFTTGMVSDMSVIRNAVAPLVAGPTGNTHNLGAGINHARSVLGHASIPDGQKYILVISDGEGTTGNSYRSQVNHAVNDGCVVAALSVGYASRPGTAEYGIMDWIGTNGGGGHLHIPSYTDFTSYFAQIKQFLSGVQGSSHVAVLIR